AEALRERLSARQTATGTETQNAAPAYIAPLFTLGDKDLLKLAFSANHVEAFFILLSAAYGIVENIKTVNKEFVDDAERSLPLGTAPVLFFLFVSVLVITLFISTTRIFFKFYGFAAMQSPLGMRLKSGLANTRERFVAFSKVQYISWRANWLRQRLGLWIFRFHTAGDEEVEKKMKAEVPITQKRLISLLAQPYHPLPDTTEVDPVRVQPAYVQRRLLLMGMVPAVVLMGALFYWWQYKALLLLLWPLFVYWRAWLFQQKFRLWVYDDVAYLRRGIWGREELVVKWELAQNISISQSLYQRRQQLANLVLDTAAGSITIPYIRLELAQQMMNYCLYKVERENKGFV
ncbi:MAG: PH domain-containing protein, partial [Chitinophagaceae bacterium]